MPDNEETNSLSLVPSRSGTLLKPSAELVARGLEELLPKTWSWKHGYLPLAGENTEKRFKRWESWDVSSNGLVVTPAILDREDDRVKRFNLEIFDLQELRLIQVIPGPQVANYTDSLPGLYQQHYYPSCAWCQNSSRLILRLPLAVTGGTMQYLLDGTGSIISEEYHYFYPISNDCSPSGQFFATSFRGADKKTALHLSCIDGEKFLPNDWFEDNPLHGATYFSMVCFSPDSTHIACITGNDDNDDCSVAVLHVPSLELKTMSDVLEGPIDLSWSADGERLVISPQSCPKNDYMLPFLFPISVTGMERTTLRIRQGDYVCACNPRRNICAFDNSDDSTISIIDLSDNSVLAVLKRKAEDVDDEDGYGYIKFAWSGDGNTLYVVSEYGEVWIGSCG